MAKIPPRNSGKGNPPEPSHDAGNLETPESSESATLNFKVTEAFKREFKIRAAQDGIQLNHLLKEAFAAYKSKHGGG